MKSINYHLKDLRKFGITKINNVLTKKECEFYVKKSNLVFKNLLKKKRTHTFNTSCQWIQSPFRYDHNFFKLIYFKKVDKILSKLLDKDYTLTNSSIVNRRIFNHKNINGSNMGDLWHTDSRYLDGKRLDKGFSYLIVLMFEDFTKENGSTRYVPGSHLLRKRPGKNSKYKYKLMTGKRGDMIIFDSGIWHRGGPPTINSRWSLFSYYSPWFVKPYYRFQEMLGGKKFSKLDKKVKKLLHYFSTPPLNDDTRIGTVLKSK